MLRWIRFCSRPVSLSKSARILSDSRTCSTSPQAEPSTWAPLKIMAASTTTTAEFKAAIDRMRQRIGTARTRPRIRARPRAARPFGRSASSCRAVAKITSLHLANALDRFRGRGVALRLGVDPGHRGFERLAVEVGHDGHACIFRLEARSFLEVVPLLAPELTGPDRGLAKDRSIFRRQGLHRPDAVVDRSRAGVVERQPDEYIRLEAGALFGDQAAHGRRRLDGRGIFVLGISGAEF